MNTRSLLPRCDPALALIVRASHKSLGKNYVRFDHGQSRKIAVQKKCRPRISPYTYKLVSYIVYDETDAKCACTVEWIDDGSHLD